MPEPDDAEGATWDATWEGVRRQQIRDWALKATPAQRLAWLEEALEIATRSGALGPRDLPPETTP